MLFPLSKDFSSSSIFQKSGQHHEKPIHRVWSIDHTGSAERTKELHLLLTDQKPYAHHERLATRRANDGKKMDQDRMNLWKEDLRDMNQKIDGESEERRQEMIGHMRLTKQRNCASDTDLKNRLRDQKQDHLNFLNDMNGRVGALAPLGSPEPPRESKERTRDRAGGQKAVNQQTKDYKDMIKELGGALDARGPQEWTAVPKPSNDAIVQRRKAKGLAEITQAKETYEAMMESMEERECVRVAGERRETRRQCREAEIRLGADKTRLLQAMSDTQQVKRAELDGIQARVNGRGSGRPEHPEFNGYATAGYAAVHKSQTRLRDHAAEKADRDANHEESASKLLCLSMALNVRNQIVSRNPPTKASSLMGTGINNPMEWTAMNWTQRWGLISRHAPQGLVQKAYEKAGVDAQGMDLGMTTASAPEQRTLSPRTLGLASTSPP